MAIFTDSPLSTIDDLTRHDSTLLEVANTENIDLTIKLNLAQEEIGVELSALFERSKSILTPLIGQAPLDTSHLAVTPAVRLWHIFQTLSVVYRDAYYSQLNDRYKGKWNEYRSLAKWALGKLLETGVGVVLDPIAQASIPMISLTPGIHLAGTLYICISHLNACGEEGSVSPVTSITAPDGSQASVQIQTPPPNVRAWNIYAGISGDHAALQNGTPLSLTQSWQGSAGSLSTGRSPGSGQTANLVRALPRMLQRG
jgi:hypothetical protein